MKRMAVIPLATVIFAGTAPAQPGPAKLTERSACGAAMLNGFIPGLGHAYAGRPGKGLALFGAYVVTLVAASASEDQRGVNARQVAGFAAMLGIYFYSIMDGADVAVRANDANGFGMKRTPPKVAADSAAAYKDPCSATLLGITPGAGHFYAGEYGRGAAILGTFVLGAPLYFPSFAAWGYSMIDAHASADRMNVAHGYHPGMLSDVRPFISPSGRARGVLVGLSARF